MRRHVTITCCAAMLLAAGAGSVAAAPPDDDPGSAAALEQFVEFAGDAGFTLIDATCSATPSEGTDFTYTCYAMTTAGEPFIARTTMSSSDVVEFVILAQPGQATDQATSGESPESGESEPARFDPLAYFDALFSGDAAQITELQAVTAPASAAEAYALFQLEFVETLAEYGGEFGDTYVFLTSEGVLICVNDATCVTATDLEVVDGRLADFAVDGNDIGPRLGRPGEPVAVGTATIQAKASYQAVTGTGALRVFVEINATEPAVWGLARAVYVGADGESMVIDATTSIGAEDSTVTGRTTAALDFPGAAPGGELLIVVYPESGDAPQAAVLPIDPVTEPRQK